MKIKKGFSLRSIMGQNVVLAEGNNADTFGKMITLNSSASMLWENLLHKEFEIEDAARLLVDKYGIDDAQAREDAEYIINLMKDKGLVE
ncbi:MAG: PqqD family protein [Muribaculaceae bacterium]|nr:PqqD family protein [Muribaculaceae bacterium]